MDKIVNEFDHTHYVPILRWKQAERGALRQLENSKVSRMTPLIELVPKAFSSQKGGKVVSVDERLHKTAKEIADNWGQAPCFVDLWHLPDQLRTKVGEHPLQALGNEARNYRLTLIPVTGLKRNVDYQAAAATLVKSNHHGICIRLFRTDLEDRGFRKNLNQLLQFLNLKPKDVDLLVDYQVIDNSGPSITAQC